MTRQNRVKIWRMPELYDAEMLKADYRQHAYPWHAHAEMTLGLVMSGAVGLRTRASDGIVGEGSFVVINAEEPHQGATCSPLGWQCRTIHVGPEILEATARELGLPRRAGRPLFPTPILEDGELASDLLTLHRVSETGAAPLESQSRLVALIGKLLARHSPTGSAPREIRREPVAVRRARLYLDENLSNKVTLAALSIASGLSPFRLLRAFRQSLGMTPHAYQAQARVRAVKSLLAAKTSLAAAALDAGFADQAHMTRVFQSIIGATPGEYRTSLAS